MRLAYLALAVIGIIGSLASFGNVFYCLANGRWLQAVGWLTLAVWLGFSAGHYVGKANG